MFRVIYLYVSETLRRCLAYLGLSLFLLLSSCTLELNLMDEASQAFFTIKPSSYSATTTAVFEFDSKMSSPTVYQCSLDASDWYSCSSPHSLSSLSSGLHTFKVLVTDTAGKYPRESSVSWVVDTDLPVLTVSQTPTALNNSTTGTFNFEATDGTSQVVGYECEHTTTTNPSSTFSSCSPLVPLVGLTQDTHTYKIRAIDSAGNRSAEFSYSWTVDLTPPSIQLTAKPAAATTSTSATFSFTNTETGGGAFVGYECKIDSDPYASCVSGISLSSLSQGTHSFVIKASDSVGNVNSLTYSWIVDSGVVTLSAFTIANGATTIGFAYTTTQLTAASSYAAITGMRFSELADFSDATWVPFAANGTVTLKNPGGLKTLYAQVRNAAGTVSNSLSDSITLDLGNPPIVAISSPVGGQTYTPGSSTIPIQWSCSPGAGPIPLATNPIRSIKYTVDDGVTFHTIAENLPNNLSATTGSYSWNLPSVTPQGQSITSAMPLKILVTCTSEAGVVTSAISNAVNSKWTVLVGEPGNLNDGVHINAADLTANVSLGAFGYFSDSQNKIYFTKYNSISTVDPASGIVTSWMGDPYTASCDIAGGKFSAPVILDINESDQMLIFSFACSIVARIRISDKAVLWSKQLPTLITNSAVLHKEQASALRYVKTGHLFYFSNEAFYMVDLNSTNKDPVLVLGNPGACGTLGAVGTMADASPIPCPTSDLYLTIVRPDLQKIWIQINGSTFELQQQGAYGKYKIGQVNMTASTWGTFFNRCTQIASQPNKLYCVRAQYEGNKIAYFDLTTETWSATFNLDKHYKNMSTIYFLGAAKDFIYAFSTTTNELYKVVDDEGVFTNSFVAGTPFFTYGNGTDSSKTAFTQISSIAYEPTSKNLYVRGPRHLRRLHVNTTTPGSEYIDTISTGFHSTAGNSSAYASLTVSSAGIAAFSQIAGTPANLWSSYNLTAWAGATVEQTLTIGPYYYQATSAASAYPAYGTANFNATGTGYNLQAARKIGTFLPNGKLYFYGSSGLNDQSDLWIFESDSTTGKIKPIAGGAGAPSYVATDHGQLALGAYLSDIYGMQPDSNGDLLVFDGNRLRKITVATESASPKIYDVINFATLTGAPTVSYWTHAVYDESTGWSYFAAAESAALSQVAQVWAAHPTPGFQQISTAGWVLPSQLTTFRAINLAVTPLGLLLLDTSKKRILKTGLLATPP